MEDKFFRSFTLICALALLLIGASGSLWCIEANASIVFLSFIVIVALVYRRNR